MTSRLGKPCIYIIDVHSQGGLGGVRGAYCGLAAGADEPKYIFAVFPQLVIQTKRHSDKA